MEPLSKEVPTDFELCLKCQKKKKTVEEKLSVPAPERYLNFLDSVNERAGLGNVEYVSIGNHLHGLTAADLHVQEAK